ncbi:cupin domain-containing protein [Kordiimonas aquimaris]|uniref:cupin domain-containing protein n=1 Tax=Kordiimonas aquimaris TaxID=707591 RepID=UPI0021D3E118|nr:cupin domain-containing protein [Kordiimonas aquimaris]
MSVTMQWLMEDSIQENAGVSLAKMTIAEGATSEAHFHADCNEVIHVLSGNIKQICDQKIILAQKGDTIFIPQGVLHHTENTGKESAILMIAYSSGSRQYSKS